MEFKTYDIPNRIKSAVYLLINNDEVIYVGQTQNGLKRIMQHNDKDFNKYAFIETPPEELNYYEDLYIMKYQPKYNNLYNSLRISVNSCYNKLKYNIKKEMNIHQFKEYIIKNDIKIEKFKNYSIIKKDEFQYLKMKLEKEYGVL